MFNPYNSSKKIKEELVDYIMTSFPFNNPSLRKQFNYQLNNIIDKGPYIDIKPIFKTDRTLKELINDNIVSKLFYDLEKDKPKDKKHKIEFNIEDRKLYTHQVEAIVKAKKSNLVVTTGTGSGKTECFLLPVINSLLEEKERNGFISKQVKVIIIYPMNALANDQLKRLRNALMYYPDITFASYTGETKYKAEEALNVYRNLHKNEKAPELRDEGIPNEIKSREEIIANPPHILITNYAMLERLLLVKDNDVLFTDSDLKYVVLDEAHVYQGTKGMETSLLIRRLKARIKHENLKFILTSATLGKQNESEDDICNFASNLTGEYFNKESIIFGQRENIIDDFEVNEIPEDFFLEASNNLSDEDNFSFLCEDYGVIYDESKDLKENLFEICKHTTYFKNLRNCYLSLNELITNAKDLPEIIGMDSLENAISFIYLASLGQKNNASLLDARYHYFLRALEGCFISFSNGPQIYLERKEKDDNDFTVFELTVCKKCGDLALYGAIEDGKLIQTSGHDEIRRKVQYFHLGNELFDKEIEDQDIDEVNEEELLDSDDFKDTKGKHKIKTYLLCTKCGKIRESRSGIKDCTCGGSYIKVYTVEERKEFDGCLNCKGGKYNKFFLGNDAATGVIATALFQELPIKDKIDLSEGYERHYEGGKQFLTFSDNRSEAAFFAVYMDKTYEMFLRRRALNYVIQNEMNKTDVWNLNVLASKIKAIFMDNKTFKENIEDEGSDLEHNAIKNAWYAVLTELVNRKRNNSLSSLGILYFEYVGLDELANKLLSIPRYKEIINEANFRDLLNELILTCCSWGAVQPGRDQYHLDEDDRAYIYYTTHQKLMILSKDYIEGSDNKTARYLSSWRPRKRANSENSYIVNSRYNLISKIVKEGTSETEKTRLLDKIFNLITVGLTTQDARMQCVNSNTWYFEASAFIVKSPYADDVSWYKCEKCGKVSNYSLNSECIVDGCHGKTNKIDDIKDYFKDNHYRKLYESDDFRKLFIKEHTAQISKNDASKYQSLFDSNKIHALSSSTTFEMGVDVGELETVFLRDVPPNASNYTQRSGRAGRSKESCAYTITYAKLSSHDFNFFSNPKEMIVGKVLPPKFKLNNQKILNRHIYAVVLAYLFKHGYMNLYSLEQSLNNETLAKIRNFLNYKEQNEELTEILKNSFADLNLGHESPENYEWIDSFCGEDGVLTQLINDFTSTTKRFDEIIESYENKYNAASSDEEKLKLDNSKNKVIRQKMIFNKHNLIDELSRGNVLPKYGFPVDIAKLDIDDADTELSRDLTYAISEYAPGETVIANGKQYVSRYIKKKHINKDNSDFRRNYVTKCENPDCGRYQYSQVEISSDDHHVCAGCGRELPADKWMHTIVPEDGFFYDPKHIDRISIANKPKKFYNTDAFYVGNNEEIQENILLMNQHKVSLKHTENDQIMVMSNNAFYVCPNCGYTLGKLDTPKTKDGVILKEFKKKMEAGVPYIYDEFEHETISNRTCNGKVFEKVYLSHVYKTDVVEITFDDIDTYEKEVMYSVMTALLDGMSNLLDIERTDIAGCLNYVNDSFRIVLYDAVPGGAGHVKRLLDKQGQIFVNVIDYALNKMRSCKCGSSCYNCLRNYYNQFHHDELNRFDVIKFLDQFVGPWKDITFEESKHIINNYLISETENTKDLKELLQNNNNCLFNQTLKQNSALLISKIEHLNIAKPNKSNCTLEINGQNAVLFAKWNNLKVVLVESDMNYNAIKKDTDYKIFNLCNSENFDELVSLLEIKND